MSANEGALGISSRRLIDSGTVTYAPAEAVSV